MNSGLFFDSTSVKINPVNLTEAMHKLHIVPPACPPQRLDHCAAEIWPELSRSRLQALIKSGHLTVNEEIWRASQRVVAGDQLRLEEPAPEPSALLAEDLPLSVLYEDSDLLVLNKAPGISVHPGAGHNSGTLVNALLHHCSDLSGIGGVERPGIVHRLDKDTSGCLLIAKNDRSHQSLAAQFAERRVLKIYIAKVRGPLKVSSGRIEAPIARHPVARQKMSVCRAGEGRNALTDYHEIGCEDGVAWVACRLGTGRTHQIRVHLLSLGHPILGDPIYGRQDAMQKNCMRLMLHAWHLGFEHPITGKWVEFSAPIPDDFGTLPSGLSKIPNGKEFSKWFRDRP